jgi:hypothetical protein
MLQRKGGSLASLGVLAQGQKAVSGGGLLAGRVPSWCLHHKGERQGARGVLFSFLFT